VRPLLEDGRMFATVEQYGDQFAVNGIELALDMVGGRAAAMDRETPTAVVTRASLDGAEEAPAP